MRCKAETFDTQSLVIQLDMNIVAAILLARSSGITSERIRIAVNRNLLTYRWFDRKLQRCREYVHLLKE
jgi:hypothetical protein